MTTKLPARTFKAGGKLVGAEHCYLLSILGFFGRFGQAMQSIFAAIVSSLSIVERSSAPVHRNPCFSLSAIDAAIIEIDLTDSPPVSGEVDNPGSRTLGKPVTQVWPEGLAVGEGYDHVVHLNRRAFHPDLELPIAPLTPPYFDAVMVTFEIDLAPTHKLPPTSPLGRYGNSGQYQQKREGS
jgi:hypothetical protein